MPPAKKETTTTKTTSRTRKAPVKKTPAEIAANARHIGENKKEIQNNTNMIHILYGFIIVLILIIAGLAFYIGSIYGGKNTTTIVNPTPNTPQTQEINITVIDDARCTDCQTDVIVDQLKALPFLSQAIFTEKDFSDDGVGMFLEENQITALPAIVFNTNTLFDGGQLTPYLQALPSGQFSLALGASFDPFEERSERGFSFIDSDTLAEVRDGLHPTGSENPEILWVEYSDLGCSACQQFHNSEITNTAFENYGDILAKAMVGFLSVGGPTSYSAMEAIECMGAQDTTVYGDAWNNFYSTGQYSSDDLESFAQENGINIPAYTSCLESDEKIEKIEAQKNLGINIFGISGTPGNIIINLETGEYMSAGWNIEPAIESLKN